MQRALRGGRFKRAVGSAAGWGARVMLAAAALTGCAVNSVGLDNVDSGDDLGGPVDRPVSPDVAPTDGAGGGSEDGGTDSGCRSCDSDTTFITLPGRRFTGTTAGRTAQNEGSCGGGDAPEAIFRIALFAPSDLFITTHGTGFNTVVYVRRDSCCGDEVACNDNADERPTSMISQRGLAAGTYYIYVDGVTASDAGPFTLDVYATPASIQAADACGNPRRISTMPVLGDTCHSQDDYSPPLGCSTAVSGPNGRDQVFYFVLDAPGEVSFNTCEGTCIDTVLYLREVCSDPSSVPTNGCDDDACRASGACQLAGNQVQSKITTTLEAGVHYLVLDTFAAAAQGCGPFAITPTGIP